MAPRPPSERNDREEANVASDLIDDTAPMNRFRSLARRLTTVTRSELAEKESVYKKSRGDDGKL